MKHFFLIAGFLIMSAAYSQTYNFGAMQLMHKVRTTGGYFSVTDSTVAFVPIGDTILKRQTYKILSKNEYEMKLDGGHKLSIVQMKGRAGDYKYNTILMFSMNTGSGFLEIHYYSMYKATKE